MLQACQAWAQTSLTLHPMSQAAPFLSSLLAQLISGCQTLSLGERLLASPSLLAFLELAQPQHLEASVEEDTKSAAVAAVLATCTSLLRLSCRDGLVPLVYAPRLRALSVDLRGADDLEVNRLLHSLETLPSLAELELNFERPRACVPSWFPCLPSLRAVSFKVMHGLPSKQEDFAAIQEAAEQGIITTLHVHLWEWYEEGDETTAECRELLWAGLAGLANLDTLYLHYEGGNAVQVPVSDRECELLSAVRCREVVLPSGFWLPGTEVLLLAAQCETALCRHLAIGRGLAAPLAWSWLTAKPGLYVLDMSARMGTEDSLTVLDCAGTLPDFTQPWALVRTNPQHSCLRGVPASVFRPGPRGFLVWRNSAASDGYLEAAYDRLGWRDGWGFCVRVD